jgi:hypothetical protein
MHPGMLPNTMPIAASSNGEKFDVNNMCMLVSTMIASYLMTKFKFDTLYYCMLQSLLLQIMMYLVFNQTYFASLFGFTIPSFNIPSYVYYGISFLVFGSMIVWYKKGYCKVVLTK